MRGSVEPVAVARDVASSSPSKPPSALDIMRYQRISPDCFPLSNGGGSRKLPAPASRSSKDDDAPAVATDSSRLASYLAATSVEPKPRARAPQPLPLSPASSSATAVATRSPARDHGHHHPTDFPDSTSPSSTGGGASGSAGPDATMLLQWGQNKRSRGRRDASAASASASSSTPSPQRRQAAVKIQRRSSAPAEKLMPPPGYPRGSNLRVSSSLPARGGSGPGDAHHGRNAHPHHRSMEERAGGQSAAASRAEKQRPPASDKAETGVMLTGTQESKHQQGGGGQAEHHCPWSSSKAAAAGQKHELPRIYTTLSRKEKEEDFLAMKGTKLPQRPKKRPKLVEKAVNFICPGTWLTDVTRSRYEVREKKCTKKQKRRGLKGMEMDSDSD